MSYFRIEKLERHSEKDVFKWLSFCNKSINSTLFHHPIFLSYHKDKFIENHLAFYKGDALFALIPMALEKKGDGFLKARSPYGASFGGFLFLKNPNYSDSKRLITDFIAYCKENSITDIQLVPQLYYHYEKSYSDTFQFSLLEAGFKNFNSEITNVISISGNIETELLNSNARNMRRKALKAGINCVFKADLNDFWILMEKTFAKHNTVSTHTKKEWEWLQINLPEDIWCDVAYYQNKPVAGIGHFKITSNVDSSFYLCSDPEFQNLQGLSLLITEVLQNSQNNGYKWFDFGTSSANMIGNERLFMFKESFGAMGVFRNTLTYKVL